METLTPGVLLKLLEEMGIERKPVNESKNPVLLQIRSIIPVLAEGDLWPSQGFYLKISDSSHAMFVSLAPEEDEMVLCNKLQLGQFIYVEKLEAAYPVPVLKGVKPIPGRQPCIGNPQDLLGVDILEKCCGGSNLMIRGRNEVKSKPAGRFRSLSPNKVRERRDVGVVQSRTRPNSPDLKGSRSCKPSSGDKDTDSESVVSNPRRRSWGGLAKTRSVDVSDFAVIKHEIKPVPQRRCHSSCASPARSATAGYDGSSEKSSTRTRTKDIGLATQSVKTSTKSKEPLTQAGFLTPAKCVETAILWNSLPSSLVNLGQEVLRQKDFALLAAVEALQEAAAAERLLKCLSSFSELQSTKDDDQQNSIDKFLKFQDYMSESKEVIQSLTTISPLRTPEPDSNSNGSIREALKLALERKKNATTWIKAALASDLTIVGITQDPPIEAATRSTSKQVSRNQKPKGSVIVRKQRNVEHFGALGGEKENQHEWMKGNGLSSVLNLAHSLQDESKTWFLSYMENYLDGFAGESSFKLSDSQFSEIMCQMKRLNDWLDLMEKRERSNGAENGSSDLEACGRIKEKIYGILLKHVERTAMVWENMNALA